MVKSAKKLVKEPPECSKLKHFLIVIINKCKYWVFFVKVRDICESDSGTRKERVARFYPLFCHFNIYGKFENIILRMPYIINSIEVANCGCTGFIIIVLVNRKHIGVQTSIILYTASVGLTMRGGFTFVYHSASLQTFQSVWEQCSIHLVYTNL